MIWVWSAVVLAPAILLLGYAYGLYPAILALLTPTKPPETREPPSEWPQVTVILPAYNEEASIGATLEAILALDYPPDRRHVLVVSDASTDRTDDIVQGYANRGVHLVRMPVRRGKTAAENAARPHFRGDIIVNTDASVRLARESLKPLVAAMLDAQVGVASGRDVSVTRNHGDANVAESGYVDYEMWVRSLETRAGGIVGASGCFFASRAVLHQEIVPEALSRDFAAPIIAQEHGYRSVSVPEAICYVPRTASLTAEYRRKVRTMARGLETLWYKRHLMNPFKHGRFAWMLCSHKLARWLVPPAALLAGVGLVVLGAAEEAARWYVVALSGSVAGVAGLAWYAPPGSLPRPVAVVGYVIWGVIAGLHAWIKALRGELNPVWEPTRRQSGVG